MSVQETPTKPFQWDEAKETAAFEVAKGEKSAAEIAALCSVTERTIFNWKDNPEFKARVEEYVAHQRAELLKRFPIADRFKRIERYSKRWNQINELIEARAAAAADNPTIPGYGTGLISGDAKTFGADVALLRMENEIAKQAAIELGDWTEKRKIDLSEIPADKLLELMRNLA